ncbi:RCC1 domain-containing protein, partial [Frankia sp. AvcI1]
TAWSWGVNWFGQLGDGTNTDSFSPVRIAIPARVTAIAGGGYSGYALGGPARRRHAEAS